MVCSSTNGTPRPVWSSTTVMAKDLGGGGGSAALGTKANGADKTRIAEPMIWTTRLILFLGPIWMAKVVSGIGRRPRTGRLAGFPRDVRCPPMDPICSSIAHQAIGERRG